MVNKLIKMLERMEDLILAGLSIPFTPWTVVHGDRLVPLMDRVRESLPEEIQQAQQVLRQRDQMLEEAHRRARQMVEDAKSQADMVLSESSLMRAVQSEADKVRNELIREMEALKLQTHSEVEALRIKALEEAKALREDAEQYADTILGALDKSLMELHQTVRAGQKHVNTTKTDARLASPAQQHRAYNSKESRERMLANQTIVPAGNTAQQAAASPYGGQPSSSKMPSRETSDKILDTLKTRAV